MNIAFFTISEINPLIGGIEKVTYNLTELFRSNGINVFFFCMRGTEHDNIFILPKTDDRRMICDYIDNKIREYDIDIIIDQYGTGNYMSHESLNADVRIVRCIHYNIVENHISACLLKTLSLKRLRHSVMNVLFWLNTPFRRRRERRNLIRWARGVDKMVLLSKTYFDSFPDRRLLDKLHAIPNVMEIPPADEVSLEIKENILMFCGRIVHNPKNILFLLKLWNRLYRDYPSWRFVLCGDGEDRTMAEDYIRKHELPRIEITGYTDPTLYYRKASILLLPSYTEGFAMVLPEAMAWGCVPIVFDASPAFYDLIADKSSGFIIRNMDQKVYETTCRKLMDDDGLRNEMAGCALRKSSDFTADKTKRKWFDLFNELKNSTL